MDARKYEAAAALKAAKEAGLNYYDACQHLREQGFSQEEITQGLYIFPYNQPLVKVDEQETVPVVSPTGVASESVSPGSSSEDGARVSSVSRNLFVLAIIELVLDIIGFFSLFLTPGISAGLLLMSLLLQGIWSLFPIYFLISKDRRAVERLLTIFIVINFILLVPSVITFSGIILTIVSRPLRAFRLLVDVGLLIYSLYVRKEVIMLRVDTLSLLEKAYKKMG